MDAAQRVWQIKRVVNKRSSCESGDGREREGNLEKSVCVRSHARVHANALIVKVVHHGGPFFRLCEARNALSRDQVQDLCVLFIGRQ